MARLAAKERLLFYPTPLEIVALIASNIIPAVGNSPEARVGSICDPCCGSGEPLAYLANQLGLIAYGNEIHPERSAQARLRLDHCLNGAREFLRVEGGFNVLFNNPPYDQDASGQRMEVEHIRHDLELLLPEGLGIWVIPETILTFDLCSLLVSQLQQVAIRRFPMPEYERFKQVVVFGLKRQSQAGYTYSAAMELEKTVRQGPPVLQSGEFAYRYTEAEVPIGRFEISFPEIGELMAELDTGGIQSGESWQTLFSAHGLGIGRFQPVLHLNPGHMAMTIAAGVVDGLEVEIEDDPHLIKGYTTKQIIVIEETESTEQGSQQTIRERERLVQTITAFNLANGGLTEYNSLDDTEGFAQFLLEHQGLLVETIEQTYAPLFKPERDMARWLPILNRVQAPGKLPGQTHAAGLLPAQQVRAAALATRLQTAKGVILQGEMGSGKSALSLGLAALIGKKNWKLVIVCPAQVVAKWKREADKVLKQFDVSVHIIDERKRQDDGQGQVRKIAKPVLDTERAMTEDRPSILVMSYETAKNGPRWEHAVWVQKRALKYRVEVEETIPTYPYKQIVEKVVTKIERVACCPDCGQLLHDAKGVPYLLSEQGQAKNELAKLLGKKQQRCNCGAALWQQVPFKYGGRTALADFLNRHHSGRYHLILDEAHHTRGADTDVGYASADLIAGAKKVIAMTGTLYSGKASGIFHMLFRLFPHFRSLYAYNEVQRFVEHHGLQETITKVKAGNRYSSTYGYTRENVRVRELPGVSPGMVTMLLNNTVFLKLADMDLHLPDYSEERLPIPLDDRLQEGLSDIASLYDDAVRLAMEGKPSLLSAWLYASLGWMDCPVDETLEARGKEGEVIATYAIEGLLADKDDLLAEPLAKDQALIELIESELGQGRGIGVFFAQVNRRDWMGRIQKLLKKRGIYAEILRQSTCKPEDRERWYRGFVKRCRLQNQEPVLLANGNLVREGLDLVELPTLIETGIEYRINDLRQRDRRSWRLIQDRPVRVIFLYYEDSWQETALQLIAAKLKAAMMVEGDLAQGLAAMDVDDGNLMDALMKAVASKRPKRVEWSGMEIAAVATPAPEYQPALLADWPQRRPVEVDVVQIDVGGGAVQLSWGDLDRATITKPSRTVTRSKSTKEKTKLTTTKVEVEAGAVQYAFL